MNALRLHVLQAVVILGMAFFPITGFSVPVYGTPTYYSFVSEYPVGNNSSFIGMFVVQEDTLINGYRYGAQNFSTTADGVVQARPLAAIYETPTPNMGTFAPPGSCGGACWNFQSNTFTDGGVSIYYTLQDINQAVGSANYQGLLTLFNANTNIQIGNASLANIAYSSGPDNVPNIAGYTAYAASIVGAPEIGSLLLPNGVFLLGCLFWIFGSRAKKLVATRGSATGCN